MTRWVGLLVGLLTVPVLARGATLEASYPLFTNLADATGTYGDVALYGNPTPPDPPTISQPLCVNGIYVNSPGGQEVRTPIISGLNLDDFQLYLEFRITASPTTWMPVLMGGTSSRWMGLYLDPDSKLGIRYNNGTPAWSDSIITPGVWYHVELRYEQGTVELHLDGVSLGSVDIGPLTTSGDHNFTSNDFSNGQAFYGCYRNLQLANDTTLESLVIFGDDFEDGNTSAWSAQVP